MQFQLEFTDPLDRPPPEGSVQLNFLAQYPAVIPILEVGDPRRWPPAPLCTQSRNLTLKNPQKSF